MAIDNQILQNFFENQKKPRIDSLVSAVSPKIRNTSKNNDIKKFESGTKQNSSKVMSNWYQSDTKVLPNRYQTGTVKEAIEKKLVPNWCQSGVETDTATGTKVIPNWYQSDTKTGFFSLSGLQKKITLLIYNLCKISRDKKTDAVSIEQISNQCKSTVGAVKTAIHRLVEKNIITRCNFKNGRGGWTVYSIQNEVYQEVLNEETQGKVIPNWYQSDTKVVSELVSKLIPSSLSGSSNVLFNNKETTTDREEPLGKSELPSPWNFVRVEPLSFLGFTLSHVQQIALQNILPCAAVQDSIDAFAFDLEENDKVKSIKGDPLNFFMGILKKGKPYAPPSNYELPQDRAMRVYLESKRVLEEKREALEKESFEFAFKDWFNALSEQEKKDLLPEHFKNAKNTQILLAHGKEYFKNNCWVKIKEKITKQ